jgi:hypothetical protein
MGELIVLSKLLPFVPAAGAVIIIIAAIYARKLLEGLGRGLDKVSALDTLPTRDRLQAIEVFENVLSIDPIKTGSLSGKERAKLIERVLEQRQSAARLRFMGYILASLVMLGFAGIWAYYAWSTTSVEKVTSSLLEGRRAEFSTVLADEGFYDVHGRELVSFLAKEAGYSEDKLNEAIERFQKLEECATNTAASRGGTTSASPDGDKPDASREIDRKEERCITALAELRQRARNREPPFDEPGRYFEAGRPDQQPRRFWAHVTRTFPFRESAIEVRNPKNDKSIILYPRPAIDTVRSDLIHLNEHQIYQLFGHKDLWGPAGVASTITVAIRPVKGNNPVLIDGACPNFWRHRDPLCSIPGRSIPLDELFELSIKDRTK